MQAVLHYIYDPLCGWCYAAEPLVWAAASIDDLDLQLHGGGLWDSPTQLPESKRRMIQQADARIATLSGQQFGEAYLSGSLLDSTLVLESRPTIAAVLAAESLDQNKALAMLRGIQHAHYVEGRRVVGRDVLCDIAVEAGLVRDPFAEALSAVAVDQHIAETRTLMGRLGASGFPTFALQIGDRWQGVAHSRFYGKPTEFTQYLRQSIQPSSAN